jgi:hypothetical protein
MLTSVRERPLVDRRIKLGLPTPKKLPAGDVTTFAFAHSAMQADVEKLAAVT